MEEKVNYPEPEPLEIKRDLEKLDVIAKDEDIVIFYGKTCKVTDGKNTAVAGTVAQAIHLFVNLKNPVPEGVRVMNKLFKDMGVALKGGYCS